MDIHLIKSILSFQERNYTIGYLSSTWQWSNSNTDFKTQAIKRNPHPDFKKVEGSRPPFKDTSINMTKTVLPSWKLGDGANDNGASLKKDHVEIDPYEEGRPAIYNYKLLISAIVPRPVGFISTRSKDGSSTNLAPFSYFQIINHDPVSHPIPSTSYQTITYRCFSHSS